MKASERYKGYMEELQAKLPIASIHETRRMDKRVRAAQDHYNIARDLESRTDDANRIDICNGDQQFIGGNYDARPNITDDPVYQILQAAFNDENEAFRELREQRAFEYKDNSRQNPQAKRHKEYFKDFLFYEGMQKIKNRTMSEDAYSQFLKKGLMFAYEESKERMESPDAKGNVR